MKLILLFSKEALNWSKEPVKTSMMLQNIFQINSILLNNQFITQFFIMV